MTDDANRSQTVGPTRGLIQGGRGGPEDELLDDGEEEVFSRAEVESGKIEHNTEAGGSADDTAPPESGPDPAAQRSVVGRPA